MYKEAGEDGLRGYLGTKKEIDFARINEVLAAFHEGKDTITLRHLERKDGEISSEETDFSGISVLLLEWTHGGSDDLHGVDLSVFLESSPEETKEREQLRQDYLADFRASLHAQLDNTWVVGPDGIKRKLVRKQKKQ